MRGNAMTIATYSELVTEMGLWLNRSDLTARIDTFIRLFEARMNRRLRSPDMEQSYSFTTVPDQDTYPISAGVRELRELHLSNGSGTDVSLNYTVTGESILFVPAPTAEYTVSYKGYATLPGLGSGQATNWLLDDHPDAYLFGSLCMAEAYLKDDERVNVWKSAWDEVLSEIIREANQKRMPPGPLVSRPAIMESPALKTNQVGIFDDPGDLASMI
jgi:hypothetical protein